MKNTDIDQKRSESYSFTEDDNKGFTGFLNSLSQLFIPTSPKLLHLAQRSILERFVTVPIEHKKFLLNSGHYLNYIDIKKPKYSENDNNQQQRKPTLVLMHGFGSGLGMFFGNYFSTAYFIIQSYN
jgi:hypothetical protein